MFLVVFCCVSDDPAWESRSISVAFPDGAVPFTGANRVNVSFVMLTEADEAPVCHPPCPIPTMARLHPSQQPPTSVSTNRNNNAKNT